MGRIKRQDIFLLNGSQHGFRSLASCLPCFSSTFRSFSAPCAALLFSSTLAIPSILIISTIMLLSANQNAHLWMTFLCCWCFTRVARCSEPHLATFNHRQGVFSAIKAKTQISNICARTGLIGKDSAFQVVFCYPCMIPIEHRNCLPLSPHGASLTVKDLWLFPPHSLSICGSIFIWPWEYDSIY